jgi:hypothetical protein
MNHSKIVGGSTAYRVIQCPASVSLSAKMPPQPSSVFADEGTLLHTVMAKILDEDASPQELLGLKYKNQEFTQELLEEKIEPALALFDALDEEYKLDFVVEKEVNLGSKFEGVFGSSDLIARSNKTAFVLDWKFGSGIMVNAKENYQGMFYAAGAMCTEETKWAFDGIEDIEIVIVQPPHISRWRTTPARIKEFLDELSFALKESAKTNPTMKTGSHCRFCPAKPTCPAVTGAVDRILSTNLKSIDPTMISTYLQQADMIEDWIKSLRELAQTMLENNINVPDFKLVAKRGMRKWADEAKAEAELINLGLQPFKAPELFSPAQAEKELKKLKKELPSELVVSVSSGNTLAESTDPRPAVVTIGLSLAKALSKI